MDGDLTYMDDKDVFPSEEMEPAVEVDWSFTQTKW
jgi:hypothetical protein